MTSAKAKAVFLPWLFLTALVWGSSAAAAEFEWEQVALSLEFQEDEPVERILRFDPQWDWDWLVLDLSGRCYLQPVADKYSKLAMDFSLPGRVSDWGLDLAYQWNEKYQLTSGGLDYRGDCYHGSRLNLAAEFETRGEVSGWDNQYRYQRDQQLFGLAHPWSAWDYQLDFSHNAKVYPGADRYTSDKLSLGQTLNWKSPSGMQIALSYQEDSGDYPNDEYMRYDYWKETWKLTWSSGRLWRWRWSGECSLQDWLQGLDPYRYARRLQLRCQSEKQLQPRLTFKLSLADLDYYSGELYYEPDEELPEEEEDLMSRVECRGALTAEWHRGNWRWGGELFQSSYDYQSPAMEDIDLLGFSVWGRWTGRSLEIFWELAPNGNLGQRDSFYKLELVYQP